MYRVNSWLVRTSRSWWLFLVIVGATFSSLAFLFALENRFEAITGLPVFDTQNDLTPSSLLQQLPRYQGAALEAYLRFAAFDFVFPFVAALFVAVTWALLLRINPSQFVQRLAWKLPVYAFLGTGFDYLENISLLSVIFLPAETPLGFVVNAAVFFKRLKLATLVLSNVLTVALLVLAAGAWFRRSRVAPELTGKT